MAWLFRMMSVLDTRTKGWLLEISRVTSSAEVLGLGKKSSFWQHDK